MPSLTIRPRDTPANGAHVQAHLAARVAEPHHVAVGEPERREVVGVHQRRRPRFARARRRRLGEAGIEEVARRRGRELERMVVVGVLVDRPMVGQGRHLAPRSLEAVVGIGRRRPIGAKWNLPSGWAKPSRKCASSNGGWQSSQRRRLELGERAAAGSAQRPVDDLARASWRSRDGARRAARRARRPPRGWSGSLRGGSIGLGPNCRYWWPPPV